MVILIGGNGCTGKTLMAQTLLEKYKIPYLSIDHLKMGIYRSDKHCGFTPLDSSEKIGEILWPIIKGIIMTNIENSQSIIIEGCYLLPHRIKEFEEPYKDEIISVFLGFSKEYIEKHLEGEIIQNRHAIEQRMYPEDRTLTQFISEHEKFRKHCLEQGVAYFEITQDYEEEIQKVYGHIDALVNKMNGGA